MKRVLAALFAGIVALGPATAQEAGPLPPKRMQVFPDTDFAGRDLGQLFDTTAEACRAACLADAACVALTFNTRNNSCFPKAEVTGQSPYAGAYSARLADIPQAARRLATTRAAELDGIAGPDRITAARALAARIAWLHPAGDTPARTLRETAARAERAGDLVEAMRRAGAAAAASDASADWAGYADLLRRLDPADAAQARRYRDRAVSAALNAYLRAGDDAARAQALFVLAQSVERAGDGAAMVPALRLAAGLSPRRDIAELQERARSLYGFRIAEHAVEQNTALPRLCATFTDPLARTGVDYADYLRLPGTDLVVEAEGRQICITGLDHGRSYDVTFRTGLPARDAQVLARDVTLSVTVPDRDPLTRFPGRGYVLARGAGAALPIETVNLDRVALDLFKVTDRNLLRTIQAQMFNRQIDPWQIDTFETEMATRIWSGRGEVRKERNQVVTTRLPMGDALAGQDPGIYALRAHAPDRDAHEAPPATQWFVLTDLGLTTWTGEDGLHVVVRGLSDAGARPGVELTLLSRANAVLGTARSDEHGVAHFAPGLLRGTGGAAPALVMARTGTGGAADLAFLSLTDPAFDLSDRGVAGREPAGAIDAFLATDRGAYRAGEVIHVTALARDAGARAIDGLPVTAILTRPDGVEHARQSRPSGHAGGYVFDFPVGPTVPRGAWRLALKSDLDAPPLATREVLVEDFLPERLEAELSLPGNGPLPARTPQTLSVAARYLYGAPAAGLGVSGSYTLAPARRIETLPGYVFGLEDGRDGPHRFRLDPVRSDAEGTARLPVVFSGYRPETPAPAQLDIRAEVHEGSGRPVERHLSRIVMPERPVIGIRPAFDGTVPERSEAAFRLLALDDRLSRIDMPVTWTLNRVTTRYQWYNRYGEWQWESFTTREPVARGTARPGTAPAEISAPVEWGRYELVVESAEDGRIAASLGFEAGWYVPADTATTPDMLEMSLDAESYTPGDTARLRLVPRHAGTALVSILSNRLIDMKVVELEAGETVVPLDVTQDWGAGAYVTATLLRPMDLEEGHEPARALGLGHAAISPGDKALSVAFTSPARADPRGTYRAELQVDGLDAGDDAFVTLAAVDVGILNLTGFEAPDPRAHYFGQRRLGVEIRDLYGRLIDPFRGEMGQLRSGGDAATTGFASPPPTEDLVTWFSGPLPVDASGHASAEIDIPAFNGTLRLMAIAWSGRGVGAAAQDLLVRDPVVVTASLPNFLAPGDRSRMLLELAHASGPAGEMAVSVEAPGLELGALPETVSLGTGASRRLDVPMTAREVGDHPITVTLTTPDGKALEKTLTLPVRHNSPATARTQRFDLGPGATFTLDARAFDGFDVDTARAVLSAGPMARLDVPGMLSLLDAYPYGCTEQVTSAALPLLAFGPVAQRLGLAGGDTAAERIDTAIATVLSRQRADGAFRLWPGSGGTGWLDAYVTDFLSRARMAGHDVPDQAFTRAIANLRNLVNYAPAFEDGVNGGGRALAYQLMVLAREGEAAMGDLRYHADVKGDDFATPLAAAQLGAALAFYGDQPRADAMFARAVAMLAPDDAADVPGDAGGIRDDFGTALRDLAGVVALAAEAGSDLADAPDLAGRLAAARGPFSTQESAWMLMAAQALQDGPGAASLSVDGAPAGGPMVRALPGNAPGPVAIRNTGETPAALTLTTIGVPEGPLAPGGQGYAIERSFHTPDGQEATIAELGTGDRLVVVLRVTPFEDTGARLMVSDPLPAGIEIDNPRLLRAGDVAALDWLETAPTEMTEFRSDRFLAALDRPDGTPFTLAYMVRAVSPGSYLYPAASVEDMYRPRDRANTGERRITVTE